MGLLDDWHFCPRCGASVAPGDGRAECAACGYVTYANPVPAACALCFDDRGRILLTRRAWEPYAGMWDLPGGFLHEDEHPLDAVRRELLEETGLEIEPTRWFGAFMVPYGEGPGTRIVLNLVWCARVLGGEEQAADDVSELRWFARDELPPLDEIAMAEPLRAWLDEPTHGSPTV
ncbi:MAG TPA: NUDIX domain-containing protein [Gaiellaceae bacterium]|nr:NUDIX domain-containing protein [Gaiellaceae bacterium]